MSLSIERRDRNSAQNDELTGTLASSPMRISGTLPDGTPLGPFELGPDDSLVLLVEELAGPRAEVTAALAETDAIAAGDQTAVLDAFRRASRLALHLEGPTHGLRPEEVPANAERLHAILHPEGLRDHEAI